MRHILDLKMGHAYECITSPDETINLICVSSGTITLLSTSSILSFPCSKSDSGTRYESYTIPSSSSSPGNQDIHNFSIIDAPQQIELMKDL